MLLKRISAPTLDEAMARVRKECGDDALLVETRHTSRGCLVVAARAAGARDLPRRNETAAAADRQLRGVRWTRGFAPLAGHALRFGVGPAVLQAVERALIGTRVDVSRPGSPALPGIASRVLKALIPTLGLPEPGHRVIALTGPTGVGKTTTLAKLAAQAVRDRRESVAIVSLDTYRMAAVEQLRAFADILQVPFEVAFTPHDLRRAVQQHGSRDRVFIDTTGRSPYDADSITALGGALEGCTPTSLLCVSAATRRRDAEAVLSGFERLDPTAAVVTKWDETEAPGEALSTLIERGIPLTHVTVGQEVPDDIVRACAGSLAAAVFGLDERQAATVL